MRTKVFITIDTDFSIGGAFADPARRSPVGTQSVVCEVNGRSEGLGFVLETLRSNEIRATFFTEALQTAYFGDEPMKGLTRQMVSAGHDVQLHLHPVWTYFDQPNWQERLTHEQPNDNMHGRSIEQLVDWMQRGIETFVRWGLPPPIALRTGNMMVDRNVYRAMARVGLPVASNVARAMFEPDEKGLRLNSGVRVIEGVTELPVLTYNGLKLGRRAERKSLTITGSSAEEVNFLLNHAHAIGSRAIVLLTHCHEFVKHDARGGLLPNRLNQSRLAAVCRYLHESRDRFEVATINDLPTHWRADACDGDPQFQVPSRLAMGRILQNKLSDRNLF